MFSGNIFSSIESVGLDARGWNALAIKSPTRTIFQTYQWLWSWEKTFKDRCEPLYILVDSLNGSGIEAVAPLMIANEFPGQRTIKFLSDGKADYCDLLCVDGRLDLLEKLFDHLFAVRERWDCIQLNSIPVESPTVAGIQYLCRRYGCRMFQRDLYSSPTLLIKGQEEEALKVFNKYSLRRRQNYFQRQGQLTFKTVQGPGVMSYLDGFFAQHIARWAGTGSPSLFLDEKNRLFYQELAQALCGTDWLVLSIVELDGRPLAMHVGFDYEGKLLWYKPCFDPAYAKHSPGLVLLRYLIGYAIEQKQDEFDFSIGDEPFKRRFCNHVRTTVQVQIFKDNFTYALAKTRQKLGSIRRMLHGKHEEN